MGLHEVLGVDHADDVVDAVTADRDPRVAVAGCHGYGLRYRQVGSRAFHVRAGNHNLPDQGVAEGDDRLDQLVLLSVDGCRGQRPVGHGQEFLLGHAGRTGPESPGQQAVRKVDQAQGDPPQRSDPSQGPGKGRQAKRKPIGGSEGRRPGQHVDQGEAGH